MRSGFRWRQGAGNAARDGSSGARRIAWPCTLMAKRNTPLLPEHLRFVHEEARGGVLHCFVLDCSGSMLAGKRLALAKGMLVALFDRARIERHEVALVCFGGERSDVRVGPAVPRGWNERWVTPIGGGGGSPLTHGVETASRLLGLAARRRPEQQRWLWILSDGRTRASTGRPAAVDHVVLVDFEQGKNRFGLLRQLAIEWGGAYFPCETLIDK